MMPQLVTVKVTSPDRRPVRIWIPVLPVLLILSPVLILAVVVAAIACLFYRVRVLAALGAGWRIMAALPGTRLDLEHGRTVLLVSIR